MKNKFLNRVISFICAAITMLNTFIPLLGNTSYAATTDDFTDSRILLVDKGVCGRYLTYNGSEIRANLVVYSAEDGKEYPSYCIEPSFQGVGSNDIPYGEYVIKNKITDDALWRVATNGYPYKTPSELGVAGEREAFFATKQAIYRLLDSDESSIDNYESLNSEGENMIETIKELYEIGKNGDEKYVEPELNITAETSETTLDDNDSNYKSQIFEVEGNCEFDEYEVLFELSDLPLGTKITDESGIEKTTFKSNEKFKVMIPIGENETTAFNVKVKANLKSMPVYEADCDNIRMQAMLVTANPYEEVQENVTIKLNKLTTDIIIEKRDNITNEGLGNATFEVSKVDGQIIGTYVTDKNGEVVVKVTESGYYKICETIPPENYLLSENNEQIINVQFNTENKAVFLNDRKSGIEILKLDKNTNKPLEGAKYRITKADGTLIGDYVTNKNGIINVQDLEPNTYQIEELESPLNYLMDTTVYNVNVVENEVSEVVLYNRPLTGIQIIKRDSLTDKPLANATFEVIMLSSNFAQANSKIGESGWYIGDFTTDETGTIHIPNLYPGIFSIKEISSPRGYNIDVETKIVEVTIDNDAIVELTNTAKAGLQIKKVDADTGKPLENVKFRVTNINGQSIGEFTTSRTGFINIPELDAGFYVVEETQALDNYILDNTPKTVEVKENAPTVVEFTNRQKGGIQILKIDESTGTPLAGAKFRVTTKSGLLIGEYQTDRQGHINLPSLDCGWFTLLEIEAPKRIYPR